MLYEINYLVLQSKTSELAKIRQETKDFLKSFGTEIEEEKEYLKRKLAYEIKHERYGFYTVLRFRFKKNNDLKELKRKLNQNSSISRYIIIRADELPSLKEQEEKEKESGQRIEEDKKTLKEEDLNKVLSKQKKPAGAEPKKEEKASSKEEKPAPAKETTSEEKVKEREPREDKPAEEKIAEENQKKTASEEEDKEKSEEKRGKKDKVSLDELDKKLDEILKS